MSKQQIVLFSSKIFLIHFNSFSKIFFFLEQIYVHRNIEVKAQRFPKYLLSPHMRCVPPTLSTFPTRVVHLFQLMSLYWYITVSVVHSTGLGKCMRTCVHHHGILQGMFIVLKILHVLLNQSSPKPTPMGISFLKNSFPFFFFLSDFRSNRLYEY